MQIASAWPKVRPLIVSLKYAYMWHALEYPRTLDMSNGAI